MKKVIVISLLSLLSLFSFSQDSLFTLSEMKQVWEPRWMPSVANLDKTWESLWNKRSDGIPIVTSSVDIKTSTTFTVSSTTTFSVVTGLRDTLEANKKYKIEALISYTADVSAGVKIGFNFSGTTSNAEVLYLRSTSSSTTSNSSPVTASFQSVDINSAYLGFTATTSGTYQISGYITTSSAGILTLQGSQNASQAAATQFLGGGTMITTKLD